MSAENDLQIVQSSGGLVADVRGMISQTREGRCSHRQREHDAALLADRQAHPVGRSSQ